MRIAVIGTGYVGITTAASLGELGHRVIGVDIDRGKIKKLSQGILPIYEPGVEELIQQYLKEGGLTFTTSIEAALKASEIIFIAVGTPSLPSGDPNMTYVEDVAREIGRHIDEYKIIVNKSTVPVGTTDWVRELIQEEMTRRNVKIDVDVVSNPEFLQEGKALHDARNPDRIVIGCSSGRARKQMIQLYEKVNAPLLVTTPRNAEMIKYASNAFLATKISFINEMARLCDRLGVDVSEVAKGMGMDKRIGPHFLQAGIGYGGSCFPKDVAALYSMGKKAQTEMSILYDVQEINQSQTQWFVDQVEKEMNGLNGKQIALLGLTFKPDTDDIREAPSLKIIPLLMQKGALVTAYDPLVGGKVREIFPEAAYADDPYDAIRDADAIVLCTEWKELLRLDWAKARENMRGNRIFDGRNALDPQKMAGCGLEYWGVGRNGEMG